MVRGEDAGDGRWPVGGFGVGVGCDAGGRFGCRRCLGEAVQISENRRLRAALGDPVLQGPGMPAIVVVHDGRMVGETYGAGFTAATPLLGWSMTKTVNAALVGMVIGDGKLSLDRRNPFAQWAGDARARISVADLMAMASGLHFNEDQGLVNDAARLEFLERDAAAFARDQALNAAPGTQFHYGSGSSVLLARGQGFDLPEDSFMLQGHLRQVMAIIPSRKLVILRMGSTPEDIGFSNARLLSAVVAAGL